MPIPKTISVAMKMPCADWFRLPILEPIVERVWITLIDLD